MLISLDQFMFCWFSLGKYGPDETLSAAAYRWAIEGKRKYPRIVIDWIFSFLRLEENHCYNAWVSEKFGKQLPESYFR
jgi:hypothetical protein